MGTKTQSIMDTPGGLGKNLILMPALLGMGYIDFEDRNILNMTIAGYCVAQFVTFSLYFFVYTRIQAAKKPDEKMDILVKAPPLPFGQENPTPDKMMTPSGYDMSKLMELVKQSLMGVGIISFIFYKWESPKPLFMQMLMAPAAIIGSELFSIYVRNKPAEGVLARPWAPAPGMFDEIKKAMDQPVEATTEAVEGEVKQAVEADKKAPEDKKDKKKAKSKEAKSKAADESKLEKVD